MGVYGPSYTVTKKVVGVFVRFRAPLRYYYPGAVAGYFGGKIEMVLMRLAEVCYPSQAFVLAICYCWYFWVSSIVNTIIALSVVGWAKYARLVRSMTLKSSR